MKTFESPLKRSASLIGSQAGVAAQDEFLVARLAAETQRADTNESLAAQLGQVVRSARLLIDADLDGFEAALKNWLGEFAQATEAIHCTFYDLVQDPTSGLPTVRALCEWVREGVPVSLPLSFDHPDVLDPRGVEDEMARITSGQVVVIHTCDTASPMREYLEQQGNVTVIAVPIFLNGQQWGCLGLDYAVRRELSSSDVMVLQTAADTLAAVLKRNQAMQAALNEREQRIAAQQARADESERLATLLGNVVRSSRGLIDAELHAFEPALLRWLGAFGEATDAIRATVYDLAIHEPSGLRTARMLCEWTRAGVEGSVPVSFAHPHVVDPRGAEDTMARWTSGHSAALHTDAATGPLKEFLEQQGNATVVVVPIFLDGQQWGCLSFDHAVKREWEASDVAVLQTAADTLAAVLKRNQAMQAALVEREQRIAAEQARADEAQDLNQLLEGVVRASRVLVDAGDFERGLQQWLAHLAQAVGADAAMLGAIAGSEQVDRVASFETYWAIDGKPHRGAAVPVTTDFTLWAERLQRGESVWAHRDELRDPASVRFWEETHCWTNLLMPVVSGEHTLGWLCFDWRERQPWQPSFAAALRTAADTLAAVLKRNQAMQSALAEREARIELERSRVTELSKANEAMRLSLDALAEAQDEDRYVQRTLIELNAQAGARATYLFRCSATDSMLHLLGSAQGRLFSRDGQASDPLLFKQGHFLPPLVLQEMMAKPGPVWRRFDAATAAQTYCADILDWHVRLGNAANAKQALMVGQRCVGVVAMVFDHAEPLSAAQQELQCALCHALALALELARLARLAQRGAEQAAVLGERHRLAREIHDGIAQSFLAIQMQLDGLTETLPVPAPIGQALSLARHGLNEARRAVAALRPQELHNRDLPSAVERLLQQMTMGSGVQPLIERPAQWQRLPMDVEEHLFRIVQEAVNNVMKHAQAGSVRVELSQAGDEVNVLVADDGLGFDVRALPAGQGFGFEGMQQRARLIGARVELLSQPREGTQVLVTLSLPQADAVNLRSELA